MPTPRITIITPSFNQALYLERAICSVLDQGYPNVEHIVVDNASSDGSVDILRMYDGDLAWWVSEHDGGPADAINKALARATGDIVGILNSDDVYPPDALHEAARAVQANCDPDWLVGRCLHIDGFDETLGQVDPSVPQSLAAFLMHDSGCVPLASTFFSRRCLHTHGYFDTSRHFAYDYEYACRLLAKGVRPTVCDAALAALREHAGSQSATCTLQKGLELVDIAESYAHVLPRGERQQLWVNCDRRRRIYALAQAETVGQRAKRFLLNEVVRHPWWIADEAVRRTLVRGVEHPVPEEVARPAA